MTECRTSGLAGLDGTTGHAAETNMRPTMTHFEVAEAAATGDIRRGVIHDGVPDIRPGRPRWHHRPAPTRPGAAEHDDRRLTSIEPRATDDVISGGPALTLFFETASAGEVDKRLRGEGQLR